MLVYLPIAELPVNALLMIALGGAVGFLSGMFGVGGGFLMTPMLIFAGVPSAVAVATGANPLIASSITGTIVQDRRKNVDVTLGLYLLAGGAAGALVGVLIIRYLRQIGQIDVFVALLYVVFMSAVGGVMLVESLRALRNVRRGDLAARRPAHRGRASRLTGTASWLARSWPHAASMSVPFRLRTVVVTPPRWSASTNVLSRSAPGS